MIQASQGLFKDELGRTLILRGVNLSGSSKIPFHPDGATFRRDGFFDHRNVSFVGRPFPLEAAEEHFTRLRAWGLTFERLLVPWEAIEHAGPGLYDRDYLDYIYAIIQKAGKYGISLFIDPHQDTWSRFSGGDGAPGWTFGAAGLDITHFKATGAAITHQEYDGTLPPMIWPSNHSKLAAATMFTLFFAGNDFAPRTKVDGVPVQDYLQGHFIKAFAELAKRIKGLPNVAGFDMFNEAGIGYTGNPDLSMAPKFRIGEAPTPYQSMLLGDGFPQELDVWELTAKGPRQMGKRLVNAGRERAWLPGRNCIWREHGVWEVGSDGQPSLLRPDYFSSVKGQAVDFNREYLRPFVNRFAAALQAVEPRTLIFMEANPRQALPEWGPQDAHNLVSAPHWYDWPVLFTKTFDPRTGSGSDGDNPLHGAREIREAYARHIRKLQREALEHLRAPTLIAETGIPFDLDGKRALRTGDFSIVVNAMERSMRAMDDALASFCLWNYSADNTNEHGDLWNDEDLSIYSPDQRSNPDDINSGGRALEAVVRPYARATAGEPLRMSFDIRRGRFEFEFRHDPACAAPTEFFIPTYRYPQGFQVTVSDGRCEIDAETQTLRYYHTDQRDIHLIKVRPA